MTNRFPIFDLSGHTAIVTGANHGIGAATACILAQCGARVLVSHLSLRDLPDPGIPESYRRNRAQNADHVLLTIQSFDGQAIACEAADDELPVWRP